MKTKEILVAIVVLLLVTALFYWFQWRPAKIRSYCDWKVRSKTNWRVTKSYNEKYNSCLHEKGLK